MHEYMNTCTVLTQPAYEGLCYKRGVPQVPHVRVEVVQHRPVDPTHHTAVQLRYVFTQGQEAGGPAAPFVHLGGRTHTHVAAVRSMHDTHNML